MRLQYKHRSSVRAKLSKAVFAVKFPKLELPTQEIDVIRQTRPDGVLLGSTPQLTSKAIAVSAKIVAVCRGEIDGELLIPTVESDDLQVGRVGAEHLIAKGFRHFAYIDGGWPWSRRRQMGFEQAVRQAGYSAEAYEMDLEQAMKQFVPSNSRQGKLDVWLTDRPKPLGVLACNDSAGRSVSRLCIDIHLKVPDDVAILGVDNDDLSTAISNPPLSSVIVPWRLMGRTASRLLDRVIDGEKVERITHLIAPTGVAERQSTCGIAIGDEQVRAAVGFIREHAERQIGVDDVVAAASTNRRMLERKFQSILGRSPLEEIRRWRIERAKALLSQTELTVKEISRQCGFASDTWFSSAFREMTGDSPANYRRMHS